MTKKMIHAGKRMRATKPKSQGRPVVPKRESYPDYLWKTGQNFMNDGFDCTAEDYGEAAQLIKDLTEVVELVFPHFSRIAPNSTINVQDILDRVNGVKS